MDYKMPFDCVYFIHAITTDFVKIGWTADLHRRFDQLQTSCPHRLELIALEVGRKEREKWYHDQLRPYRRQGEWFLLLDPIRRWLSISLACDEVSFQYHKHFRHARLKNDNDSIDYRLWMIDVERMCGRPVPCIDSEAAQ